MEDQKRTGQIVKQIFLTIKGEHSGEKGNLQGVQGGLYSNQQRNKIKGLEQRLKRLSDNNKGGAKSIYWLKGRAWTTHAFCCVQILHMQAHREELAFKIGWAIHRQERRCRACAFCQILQWQTTVDDDNEYRVLCHSMRQTHQGVCGDMKTTMTRVVLNALDNETGTRLSHPITNIGMKMRNDVWRS